MNTITEAEKQEPAREFDLGSCVMTQTVAAEMKRNEGFRFECALAMERHKNRDWREMDAEDQRANTLATIDGSRVVSGYDSSAGRLCIITEWDRSYTTIMFLREY